MPTEETSVHSSGRKESHQRYDVKSLFIISVHRFLVPRDDKARIIIAASIMQF